jgi:DNA-binding NarL/FixJ family response regulator
VVDLNLPDGDGSDLISELHRANRGISVLVLSVTLSLPFKHESFGLDIKPLAKLPLALSS